MRKDKEQLNNGAAPEKKKFMKSVASWFVEEEDDQEFDAPVDQDYEESSGYAPETDQPVYETESAVSEYDAEPAVQQVPGGTAAYAAAASEASQKAAEEPETSKKAKKDKKSKDKKKVAENGADKPEKKRRRIPGILIFLIIVVIIAAGLYIHITTDIHDKNTENRGTVIGSAYCYYIESKDQVVKYSTSSGPKVVKNTDEEFEKLMSKLRPADRSAERYEYADEVAAVIGDSFNKSSYQFIDYASKCVLFSYPNKGVPALWLYNQKYGTAEPVVTGANIRGIAFGNFIIYARDDDQNKTVCYRVSTSYSGQVLSVDEFRTVSKSPVTFWSSTFWDLVRGLVRGLKASTDSR